MARTRMIKPTFFKHGDLFDLEEKTGLPVRVAFAGLWTVADRAGRFKWRARELKLEVLPFDQVDFSEVLEALESCGFIRSYEVDGQRYGVIPTFAEHQSFHIREAASTLPCPPWEGAEQTPPPAEDAASTSQGSDKHQPSTSQGSDKAVSSRPASTSTSTSASVTARTTSTTTATAREELVELLPEAYEPDLVSLLERTPAQNHLSWLRSLLALTSGLHPPGAGLPKAVPPAALGEAIRQFNTNGETNWKRFTGYVRAVLTPPPEPAVSGGPKSAGTKTERAAAAGRTTYETAMAILGGSGATGVPS